MIDVTNENNNSNQHLKESTVNSDENQLKKNSDNDSGNSNNTNKSNDITIISNKTNKEDNIIQNINNSEMNSISDHVGNNQSIENYHQLNNRISSSNNDNEKDINYLQNQVKKLQKLLLSEQDKFTKLQKRLQDSENQRLGVISENNKDIFSLNSQCTKLRAELEKSEAIRQSIEFELSVARNSFNKERNIILGKEKVSEEINKNLEEKYNLLNNENTQLKARLQIIDNEYSSELLKIRTSLDEKQKYLDKFQTEQDLIEKERQTLNSFIKDQDKLISQLKGELDLNKEAIKKLTSQLDNSKDKEERFKKDAESLTNRLTVLEEAYDKEKNLSLERKYNLDISQVKHKECLDQLKTYENIKAELELNIAKLIEQLKENRKELSEEQMRNREMKERFKICETQFKTLNSDLMHKIEEKTNTIKSLSKQLSAYDANLNEIKYELNNTKAKQGELDDIYNTSMKNIDYLIKSFTIKDNDFKYKQNNLMSNITPNGCPNLINSVNLLKVTLEEYKKQATYAFEQARESKYKIENFNSEYDKFKQINDSKEKLILQCEEIKIKQENEINTLRHERVALEEVINSLRVECDTLKTSLNREYETNDTNKKQINRLNKSLKQGEEQRSTYLQSLYKQLTPILSTPKSINNINVTTDENLEQLIEKSIKNIITNIQTYEDNLNEIEFKFKKKETTYIETQKKHEDEIKNLSKILIEKETIFNKQKESLVNYYEQLINDVNSRVKLYVEGYMMKPSWVK